MILFIFLVMYLDYPIDYYIRKELTVIFLCWNIIVPQLFLVLFLILFWKYLSGKEKADHFLKHVFRPTDPTLEG